MRLTPHESRWSAMENADAPNAPPTIALPPDHPQRFSLNDEVHARPPERLGAPCRVSFLALVAPRERRADAWAVIAEAAKRFGAPPPDESADHYSADFGPYRVKAERHTEFIRLKIIVAGLGSGGEAHPFAEPAIVAAGADWAAKMPGELLWATHAAIVPAGTRPLDSAALTADLMGADSLIGASIAGGAGAAFTDLRIREDGFSRLLIVDRGMTPSQMGRALQRLVEMDTYRMLALLAFPIARARMPELSAIEAELASVTAALVDAREEDDPALLERLTKLAAQIENGNSETQFRFAASASYYDLVKRRVQELREDRLPGLQTFGEFMQRRLAPAMRTCRAMTERQEVLSARVARATDLLSTRVEIFSEKQSHALLDSMNRRAQTQLRLQETVEGLSVAAITYYVVSLVGHAAEGLQAAGAKVDPTLAMAVAIPVVALAVAYAVRRVRRKVRARA